LPPFYLQTEVLFMHRNNRSIDQPLVYDNTTGNQLVSTRDLGFHDWAPGAKILAGYRFASGAAFEASYFGFQDWNTYAGASSPANLSTPGDLGFFGDDYSQADSIRIGYNSRLHNFEANYFVPLSRVSLLVGFRYISWNETLNISSTTTYNGAQENSDYTVQADNNLFGLQVGGRVQGSWRRLRFDFTPKVGLYGNSFSQRSLILDDGNTFVGRDTWIYYSDFAFVGDMALNIAYQISPHFALRAGYNLIFIDGLALAPNQLDFNLGRHSGFEHNHSGSVMLQGFNAGLEARW
jgi:hypothetical protein